jgi:hypothetical protein
MKVKIFSDDNYEYLEKAVNQWLQTRRNINDILQSQSGDWVVITIFYFDID